MAVGTHTQSEGVSSAKIRELERQKQHYENQLLKRCLEVEFLKREKLRLQDKVQRKEALAAARLHQKQQQQ